MKKRIACLLLALCLLSSLMPGAMAASSLDQYAVVIFGKSYPVYSGPGTHYFRANSGKATYGGADARVFGITGDWIMIGYMLGSGDYRIGYISKDALNHIQSVRGNINGSLAFSNITAYTLEGAYVTDDPVMNAKSVHRPAAGTAVTVLATMGSSWTYVELPAGGSSMRGFIQNSKLRYNPGEGPEAADPTIYVPYVPPITPAPTPAPTRTPAPYYPPVTNPPYYVWPTPTPVVYNYNTYYHDSYKGNWLPNYQYVTLNQSWPVYSGPGEYYYRANSNRATVGSGRCMLYGVDGSGWAMIGYALSNGNFRIGYINASALPQQGMYIPYLDTVNQPRRLIMNVDLTDDIVRYKPTVASLSAGTYVLFLGYCYGLNTAWAYVEVWANNALMRGFVPAYALGQANDYEAGNG